MQQHYLRSLSWYTDVKHILRLSRAIPGLFAGSQQHDSSVAKGAGSASDPRSHLACSIYRPH